MKRMISILLLLFLLSGCAALPKIPELTLPAPTDPVAITQPATTAPTLPPKKNGWIEEGGSRFYYVQDQRLTGWQNLDGNFYFFRDDGTMYTGFLKFEEDLYYLRPDGTMATGAVTVDEKTYYFTASGKQILLVNPWNAVPEDYDPQLVELKGSYAKSNMFVEQSCYNDLVAMLEECNRVCPRVCVVSSYRTHLDQAILYENKIRRVMAATGLEWDKAAVEAAKVVAIPDTSEHQLGLAVDILDTREWVLEEIQETLPAQQWLMQNSWRFGFILRYPKDKTDVTGIIYEPWHYRYVGKELAAELFTTGLTLEEYLQNLTQ